jgi:TetR/AcrR family transcriptional repressor of nem operon
MAPRPTSARDDLLAAGIELFRRNGYVATTVDDICAQAGVTKGAFFHHFDSKEALAEACLRLWDTLAAARAQSAEYHAIDDPVERLLACLDFYIAMFEDPGLLKSCLAGTVVQEISESNTVLRDAAQQCFLHAEEHFASLLEAAARAKRKKLDATALAQLWMATLQGSLILHKASQDDRVIARNLRQIREHISFLLGGAGEK